MPLDRYWIENENHFLINYSINGFIAIIRNRCASLMTRVRGCPNIILNGISWIDGIPRCCVAGAAPR